MDNAPHPDILADPPLGGWLDSPRIRLMLLVGSASLLLLLWLPPSLEVLRHSSDWFPVWVHTAMETFSVVVSILVFAICWHAYQPDRPGNLMLLACGFLATGLLDFMHLLSYAQMPAFITPSSPQKAISFWLCARLLSAAVLLAVAIRPWRPLDNPGNRYLMLSGSLLLLVACIAYAGLAHPERWPEFYIAGEGLTPIKLAIEWIVVALFALAAIRLWWLPREQSPFDRGGLLTAALLWILSELALMVYVSVNDVFSLVGHTYKVLGFLLVYRLVFVASVQEPFQRLAQEMKVRHEAQAKVESLAFYDGLTGLPNRALLRDRVQQARAAHTSDALPCALLVINIDAFREINDSLGPAYGDAVLRRFADRIGSTISPSDSVAKLDGDEFAVLMREVADADAAGDMAESLLTSARVPMQVFERELRLGASIGVALAPTDGGDFDALMQSASTALHKAKAAGGNSWRFYDTGMNREVVEHLNLRHDLQAALERQQFVLHYQPQFDLLSGDLTGIEALLRWQHPEQGLVAPGRFIGEAEDSGLIVPIGQWVLLQACRDTSRWRRAGLPIPLVAVNLSAKQFQRSDVAATVMSALATSGLGAEHLELELTESILVQDAEKVLDTLNRLKSLGISLSIDDFGTGYSSLAYLRRFPIDKLKIDQSFVRDIGSAVNGEALVTAVVQLAGSLGLQTLAEGVEDAATSEVLARLGCQQVQGFHFARPMPADALGAWLSERMQRRLEPQGG